MGKTPILFINLDRATERAGHMWASLDALELGERTTRFSAVDASQGQLRRGFRRKLRGQAWDLSDAAVACMESHRQAWQRMLDQGWDRAVILEDDVVFSPGFAAALDDIEVRKEPFDCVKLDGVPVGLRLGKPMSFGSVRLRRLHQVVFSSAGYVLSRRGAERLVRETESYSEATDIMMYEPRKDWVAYQIDPGICVQGMLVSSEESAKLPPSVAGSERLDGAMWYQVKSRAPIWWRAKTYLQAKLGRELPRKLWRDKAFVRAGGEILRVPLQDDFATYRW